MIGAIIGDVVGSVYEFDNIKTKKFPLLTEESTFTDDTAMTCALAEFINSDHGNPGQARLISYIYRWFSKYPELSYGRGFLNWIRKNQGSDFVFWKFNDSYGNGAAMRISPIGDMMIDVATVKRNAKWVTEPTHGHEEGIKGAQAVATLIALAKKEKDKAKLKAFIEKEYGYDLSRTMAQLKKENEFNETCQKTVPEAIGCFLHSKNFEDAIRNAISIGGDSDTIACITGSIAEAYYQEIDEQLIKDVMAKLPLDMQWVVKKFYLEISHLYPVIAKTIEKV